MQLRLDEMFHNRLGFEVQAYLCLDFVVAAREAFVLAHMFRP